MTPLDIYSEAVAWAAACENRIKKMYPNRSLCIYSAKDVVVPWINKIAVYMEAPIRDTDILGHTFEDDLGISTMVNSLIENPCRKLFTQTHELGHLLLDKGHLRDSENLDLIQNEQIRAHTFRERRANIFSAKVILPDDVLDAAIKAGFTKAQIREHSCVSYETLEIALEEYLLRHFRLKLSLAKLITKEFMITPPQYESETGLYEYWSVAQDSLLLPVGSNVASVNEEKALYYFEPDILQNRNRKRERVMINRMNRMDFRTIDEYTRMASALAETMTFDMDIDGAFDDNNQSNQ